MVVVIAAFRGSSGVKTTGWRALRSSAPPPPPPKPNSNGKNSQTDSGISTRLLSDNDDDEKQEEEKEEEEDDDDKELGKTLSKDGQQTLTEGGLGDQASDRNRANPHRISQSTRGLAKTKDRSQAGFTVKQGVITISEDNGSSIAWRREALTDERSTTFFVRTRQRRIVNQTNMSLTLFQRHH